jgi:hypothetical protein
MSVQSEQVLPRVAANGIEAGHRRVIFASSLGTVFEWFDFYLYGTLAVFFGTLFFPPGHETAAFLRASLSAASTAVPRPTWPSTRRLGSAATTRAGFRPRPRSDFSCPSP